MKHSAGFLRLVEQSRQRIREIGKDEIAGRLPATSFHLIDVREDHEWQAGHIASARHLGKGIIERDIEAAVPDKEAEIVLYCGGGFRSALAADALQQMGYSNVRSLIGGYKEWTASGLPTE